MDENLVIVTFIGGSANLTQRVMRRFELGPYCDVPRMPDLSEYAPGYEPEMVHAHRERYIVHQVASSYFVALYEYIR